MIQTLSLVLIIFGTAAATLALPVVRRSLGEQLDSLTDFFFGDRKPAALIPAKQDEPAKQDIKDVQATSRREIDNFDLSIFEDF